jgi:excisionase family DNA binding protein
MKIALDQEDIEAIAQRVVEILKPYVAQNGKVEAVDTILDVPGLAGYLKVSTKWIYERTHLKEIPYIKVGGQLRFSRKDIDKWLLAGKIPAVNTSGRFLNAIK